MRSTAQLKLGGSRRNVAAMVNFDMSPSWFRLIYCDLALLSIGLICYLATVAIRFKSSTFWIFKRFESTAGNVVLPNTTIVFTILSILFSVAAIPSIALMAAGFKGMVRGDAYQFLYALVWPLSECLTLCLLAC